MINKIALLLLIIISTSNAQVSKCQIAHIGTFELDMKEYGILRIERTESKQFETSELLKLKVEYDILWIDDCNYELKNRKIIEGESMGKQKTTDILKVQILKIEKEKILLRLSSNYADLVTECEIVKIE